MGLTTTPRETEIQKEILRLLHGHGIPAWRINSRVVTLPGSSGLYRMGGVKGMADILAVLPGSGRFIALEVKRPGAKLTLHQDAFLNLVTRTGGIGARVTCPNDVLELLKRHGWER
jgi:VRR-NUC domain-containing protein